jgi:hypothetical protein
MQAVELEDVLVLHAFFARSLPMGRMNGQLAKQIGLRPLSHGTQFDWHWRCHYKFQNSKVSSSISPCVESCTNNA